MNVPRRLSILCSTLDRPPLFRIASRHSLTSSAKALCANLKLARLAQQVAHNLLGPKASEHNFQDACSITRHRGVGMEGSVYLKARQEWDERYADLVLGKRNWQIAAAGLMVITLVLAFGMVWLSTRSRFVPYVIEVDKLGYALAAPSALTESTTQISSDRMVRYELAAFIRNAREVISDPAAEHQQIGQVYRRARGVKNRLKLAFANRLAPERVWIGISKWKFRSQFARRMLVFS
jgi:hypothetical protein